MYLAVVEYLEVPLHTLEELQFTVTHQGVGGGGVDVVDNQ